jgi:hypothetical protein
LNANGGKPVGLFSPTVWEDGSSGSHLDDENPALSGRLMLSAFDVGPYTRELTDVERAILIDLGYQMKLAQPNPGPPAGDADFDLAIELDGDSALIFITGATGDYLIESTSDFETWEVLTSITIEDGDGGIAAFFEEDLGDLQFYRASVESINLRA